MRAARCPPRTLGSSMRLNAHCFKEPGYVEPDYQNSLSQLPSVVFHHFHRKSLQRFRVAVRSHEALTFLQRSPSIPASILPQSCFLRRVLWPSCVHIWLPVCLKHQLSGDRADGGGGDACGVRVLSTSARRAVLQNGTIAVTQVPTIPTVLSPFVYHPAFLGSWVLTAT